MVRFVRCVVKTVVFGVVLAIVLGISETARADVASVPHPYAYGVLVGTNLGGPGQTPLRYAEDDARRVASVLRELGRYGQADLRVLVRPTPVSVLAAVDEVAAKIRAHEARGEQAVLVFYYSGHAKANAFNLGDGELSIALLRDRLRQIPTTLTLVVLDACQSGQFARVKGAEPAADFSYNSVSRLTTKGIAVMASSSERELSQESDELRSSYFTHHLVVGLRGAADLDRDGRVSLDEAYRYAYQRTLTSTAETKVGSQHVTLEMDLAGQGDVPVTYPAAARSQLELPATLGARVLVQHKTSGNVVAEVQKSKGSALRLAFAEGAYEALVRDAGTPSKVLRCRLSLFDNRVTPLDLGSCATVQQTGVAKGDVDRAGDLAGERPLDPWTVEAALGFMGRVDDGFTRRLSEFGYEQDSGFVDLPRGRASLAVYRGLLRHLSLGGQLTTLSGDLYRRRAGDSDDSFTFDAYGASAFAQLSTSPLGRRGPRSGYFEFYARLGAGVTLGFSTLTTGSSLSRTRETTDDAQFGWMVGGAGGASIVLPRLAALFMQLGYEYAPTFANETGETHDAGGPSGQLGVRFRFGQ